MKLKRIHAVVEGRVQGVFFRASTQDEARRLSLSGWVRNLPDGRVETEFEGEDGKVGIMCLWLQHGPPRSQVNNVVFNDRHLVAGEIDFTIRY